MLLALAALPCLRYQSQVYPNSSFSLCLFRNASASFEEWPRPPITLSCGTFFGWATQQPQQLEPPPQPDLFSGGQLWMWYMHGDDCPGFGNRLTRVGFECALGDATTLSPPAEYDVCKFTTTVGLPQWCAVSPQATPSSSPTPSASARPPGTSASALPPPPLQQQQPLSTAAAVAVGAGGMTLAIALGAAACRALAQRAPPAPPGAGGAALAVNGGDEYTELPDGGALALAPPPPAQQQKQQQQQQQRAAFNPLVQQRVFF